MKVYYIDPERGLHSKEGLPHMCTLKVPILEESKRYSPYPQIEKLTMKLIEMPIFEFRFYNSDKEHDYEIYYIASSTKHEAKFIFDIIKPKYDLTADILIYQDHQAPLDYINNLLKDKLAKELINKFEIKYTKEKGVESQYNNCDKYTAKLKSMQF